MKRKDIKLKNIKTFLGREGYGLNADVYVGKVKVAFVMDMADGGEFRYDVFDKDKFAELKEFALNLPAVEVKYGDRTTSLEMDIDLLIDEIFAEQEKAKVQKKMKKQMEKNILYGTPGGSSYKMVGWRIPISEIIKKFGVAVVKNVITDIEVNKLKKGEEILNTNFKALGLIK